MATLFLAWVSLSVVMAADWKDVTSAFIQNPDFDQNSSKGWTWTSDAGSQTVRVECMEFWNGTFDIWQELSDLPQGRYRLSVQSYYRPGNNDECYNNYVNNNYEGEMTACLYAGDNQLTLVSPYSYEFPDWVDGCWSIGGNWWGGGVVHYFPNTMESAAVAFANGAYQNVMEFDAEGDIRIGLRNEVYRNGNWCIFDHFKLEYSGAIVMVQSISLSMAKSEIVVGESVQCTATVLPANALNKKLTWESSDESVVRVDNQGLVTGLSEGEAEIIVRATDGSDQFASIGVKVKRNEVTASQLVINEIMASNVDEYVSPAFNFDGWMELYNPTDKSATLAGLYLSDESTNLLKWRMPVSVGALPAKGYKLVWFDSNDLAPQNAPFQLDVDGGTIYISSSDGKLLASQSYPSSMERVSYARKTDGGNEWGLTGNPTPGAPNAKSTFASQQLAAPVVDQPSQLFSGAISVNVTIPAGSTLRYTTDGSLPTLSNGFSSTRGQFNVNETRIYRFRLFANGMLPSRVTTRSYIAHDRDYSLPVVSVVGDWNHLYGDSLGVLVMGVNGRPGNGQSSPCNWNMNWERPVNFSYLDANGTMVLNQDVNLEMCGGWSRAWA
ncbi:MAG: Ig-like domain-containing protein, partial [Prevotella sp.]|nr:Ig-like domain-containing protein [Prevotella sp.]